MDRGIGLVFVFGSIYVNQYHFKISTNTIDNKGTFVTFIESRETKSNGILDQ